MRVRVLEGRLCVEERLGEGREWLYVYVVYGCHKLN